jgi:hypothetical protein
MVVWCTFLVRPIGLHTSPPSRQPTHRRRVFRLLALCLLIFHAIAPAPSARVASGEQRAQASGGPASAVVAAQRGGDAPADESVSLDAGHSETVAWVRDARPFAGILATRGDAPARMPVYGLSVGRLSMEAAFAASVRVRTLDDSHAVSARGALLPYFPTAPPLRG